MCTTMLHTVEAMHELYAHAKPFKNYPETSKPENWTNLTRKRFTPVQVMYETTVYPTQSPYQRFQGYASYEACEHLRELPA